MGVIGLDFFVEVTYLTEDRDFVFIYLELWSFMYICSMYCLQVCHRPLTYIVERSVYLFILSSGKKKKNPLQYLLKAQFFILWTLMGLGCDNWWGGNIILGPIEATFF